MADEIDGAARGPTIGRRSGHSGRVQVIARMSSRRQWSRTADYHAIGAGQICTWRRLALNGSLGAPRPAVPRFARVEITDAPPQGSAVARGSLDDAIGSSPIRDVQVK